ASCASRSPTPAPDSTSGTAASRATTATEASGSSSWKRSRTAGGPCATSPRGYGSKSSTAAGSRSRRGDDRLVGRRVESQCLKRLAPRRIGGGPDQAAPGVELVDEVDLELRHPVATA